MVRDRTHELRPHDVYQHMMDEEMKAINANYIDYLEAVKQHTKAQLEALKFESEFDPTIGKLTTTGDPDEPF